jgi:lipid II:glycine glycyltransferase (peptidoglycan interpeptide bridge formation enzyme)
MYKIEINQITESKHQNDGTFLQTPFWCQFKSRHGWTYRRFNVNYTLPAEQDDNECTKSQVKQDLNKSFELAVLNRSFAKGLFSIAYIPLMPELPFECTPQKIIDQALDVSDN